MRGFSHHHDASIIGTTMRSFFLEDFKLSFVCCGRGIFTCMHAGSSRYRFTIQASKIKFYPNFFSIDDDEEISQSWKFALYVIHRHKMLLKTTFLHSLLSGSEWFTLDSGSRREWDAPSAAIEIHVVLCVRLLLNRSEQGKRGNKKRWKAVLRILWEKKNLSFMLLLLRRPSTELCAFYSNTWDMR